MERFFEVLICGDRQGARDIVDECLEADVSADQLINQLFWPSLEKVQQMYRADQLSVLCYNYATRLLRLLVDQMQLRLDRVQGTGRKLLVLCGPNESNELAGQIGADLLEAAGHEVYFGGGGVAKDEIIAQIGTLEPDAVVLFSSAPQDLPEIRRLIDEMHDLDICPRVQVVVGGGVFNRAPGLAEEIGADVWAVTPTELVDAVTQNPEQRMPSDQRTVGRRRRSSAA